MDNTDPDGVCPTMGSWVTGHSGPKRATDSILRRSGLVPGKTETSGSPGIDRSRHLQRGMGRDQARAAAVSDARIPFPVRWDFYHRLERPGSVKPVQGLRNLDEMGGFIGGWRSSCAGRRAMFTQTRLSTFTILVAGDSVAKTGCGSKLCRSGVASIAR